MNPESSESTSYPAGILPLAASVGRSAACIRMVQDTGLTLPTTVYTPQVDIDIPPTELEFNAPKAR